MNDRKMQPVPDDAECGFCDADDASAAIVSDGRIDHACRSCHLERVFE